jgi:hypothetical protein
MSDTWGETFEREWNAYFDELDAHVERLDSLADKAEKEGFHELTGQLFEASNALMKHALLCARFLDRQSIVMTAELYRQNPMLKMLLESSLGDGSLEKPWRLE